MSEIGRMKDRGKPRGGYNEGAHVSFSPNIDDKGTYKSIGQRGVIISGKRVD